jgi:predicted NBD/HSP70 family sugar kinase
MARLPRRRKTAPSSQELLVGVDGGATEVKVHEILVLEREEGLRLDLGPASASVLYDRTPQFQPVAMAQQLLEEQRGELQLPAEERAEGRLVLEAFVRAILSVAEQAGRRHLRIGVCLPGVKSADGRGVVVMRNGPRLPDFLAQLEGRLALSGVELAAPIPPLLSDGEACALGENLGFEGLLKDVPNAYYLGGGTGLAEACKLDGQVVDMDALRPWMRKAWQLEDKHGQSFEDLASARGINERYARRRGVEPTPGAEVYPEARVALGDPDAEAVLRAAGETLAQLFFARIQTCATAEKLPRAGRSARAGAASPANLEPGTVLQRLVIGQQLGRLVCEPGLARVLREPLEQKLAKLLSGTKDPFLAQHYLVGRAIRPGLIEASLLRAAPAIGAAARSLAPARPNPARNPASKPEAPAESQPPGTKSEGSRG